MPRPRLPAQKAAVSGAAIKDPGRFKDRKSAPKARPIGAPYQGMTPEQVAVWNEQVENMPWLNAGHRLILRQVCILAARMETDPDMGVSALQALGAALSKLGATPVDETKVIIRQAIDSSASDADIVLQILEKWDADVALDADGLKLLDDHQPGAVRAIIEAYGEALAVARRKN